MPIKLIKSISRKPGRYITYVPKFRQINVYIESGETRVFTHFKSPSKLVIEPLDPENDSLEMNVRRPRRKETESCSRKLRLESPPRSQVYDLAIVPHTNSHVRNDLEKPHTKSGIFLSDEEDLGGSVTQVEEVAAVQRDEDAQVKNVGVFKKIFQLWKIYLNCHFTLNPPKHHKQVGRPKKKRHRGFDELGNHPTKLTRKYLTVTCGKCHNKGHNSRTCRGRR
ncbi:hypothetical protein LXL04_021164 [Taraxacum kok-saghyz]